jgi:hypothetical protein
LTKVDVDPYSENLKMLLREVKVDINKCRWSLALATREAEIRRIWVQSQFR